MRFVLLAFAFLAPVCASAQPSSEQFGVRVNVGYGSTMHKGELDKTQGIIDCGEISQGSGTGLVGSVGFEYPLSRGFGIGLELGFYQRGGVFTRENSYPLRDSMTGNEVTMLAAHTMRTTLNTIDFAPNFIIPVLGTVQARTLGLQIGPRIALVQNASYVQEEKVISPDNAVFIKDGKAYQYRTIDANNFAAASSMLIGATASLESSIGVTSRLSIMPRVSYDMFFTRALTDVNWGVSGVRGEIGLRWSIPPAQPAFIPPPPPPPPVIVNNTPPPPPTFAPPQIALTAGPFTGEVVTGNTLRASIPIVNAVFFDSASAEIPANYRISRDGSVMSSDAVAAHDWIMIRIANIVAENPNARVILEGATSGPANEQDASVAKRRAENVRRAMIGLGVPESAISIKSLVTPRIPSNNDLVGGREENRRVDIVVQNAPLQRWVQSEEFAEAHGNLQLTATMIGGDPSKRPSEMTFTVVDRDTVVPLASTYVTADAVIPVDVSASTLSIPTRASAGGSVAQQVLEVDVTKLPRRRIALRADRFEAVLRFDYNSSELPDDVKILLQQLADQLPEGSTITIEGSADILGSQERNRVLSESRASTTTTYIKSITKKTFRFTETTTNESFSNDTPQGRFLNRNIRIRVTTP